MRRLSAPSGSKLFWENTEDMFWEIPKDDILTPVRWACSLVKPGTGAESLMFAIAKGHLFGPVPQRDVCGSP